MRKLRKKHWCQAQMCWRGQGHEWWLKMPGRQCRRRRRIECFQARDRIKRSWGHGAFDMVCRWRRPRSERVRGSRMASLIIAGKWLNVMMQTTLLAMSANATLPRGEVCGHLSDELDPLLVHEGCWESAMRTFASLERMRECRWHQTAGKRVRVQWFDDYKRNVDGSVFERSRLVAMPIAWETRTDCFAESIVLRETRVELCSRAVQSREKQIAQSPRRVGSIHTTHWWGHLCWLPSPTGE